MSPKHTPAEKLRNQFIGSTVGFRWFRGQRRVSSQHAHEVATTLDAADDRIVPPSKRLLDHRMPEVKQLVKLKNTALAEWRDRTLPYPERGIRLLRKSLLVAHEDAMKLLQSQIDEAAAQLENRRAEIIADAATKLGKTFNFADFPSSFVGAFQINLGYPSLHPDEALKYLNIAVYDTQNAMVAERFDQAVALAEQAFRDELAKLVARMCERLDGKLDKGKPKVFRDSLVTNLTDFFAQFKQLNVGSSDELDELVAKAQMAVKGVTPDKLRDNAQLQQSVRKQMLKIETKLTGAMVAKPTRKLMKKKIA